MKELRSEEEEGGAEGCPQEGEGRAKAAGTMLSSTTCGQPPLQLGLCPMKLLTLKMSS